ncbi:MAG TPA: DUF4595 domain-containing protein [Puia sp.]|jgi:hypothetical protein|nr:DUF4595 domain-containing protein [Puia sp.]
MKKLILSLPVIACLFVLTPSCSKKSSGGSAASSCQIITILDSSSSGNTIFNLTYNNNGKVSTIQNTSVTNPTTEVFTYSGNDILITTTGTGNVFVSSDSIVTNSAGLITFSQLVDASSDTTVYTFTYDGNNDLLKQTSQTNSGTISTSTFTYTNGDLTSSSDGTNTTTYSYTNSKPSENGDYIHIFQLFNYGGQAIKTAHLIQSLTAGSTVDNFNYTFDSSGKITSLTLTSGAVVETVSYQYQCN